MSVGIVDTNIAKRKAIKATVDLGSVAANTTETETATVTGVKVGDIVTAAIKPTLEAGLLIGSCWVSAADTVSIQVGNLTASPINEASEEWTFIIERPEGVSTDLESAF